MWSGAARAADRPQALAGEPAAAAQQIDAVLRQPALLAGEHSPPTTMTS
jgi:hypothetical protein